MRKLKYIAVFFFAIIISVALVYFIGGLQKNTGSFISRHATRFFDYSSIETLSALDSYPLNSLIIVQQGNGIVFKEGKRKKRVVNNHGTTCFLTYRNNELLSEVCFFRRNYWHINNYTFHVELFEDEPFVFIDIEGPDSAENLAYKKYTPLINDEVEVKYLNENKEVYYTDTILQSSLDISFVSNK